MVVEEKVETIMVSPYLNAREQAVVREAMQKMKKEEFSFVYRNIEYHALLTPIESNGWYLLCINSLQNVNKNVYMYCCTCGGNLFRVDRWIVYFYLGVWISNDENDESQFKEDGIL